MPLAFFCISIPFCSPCFLCLNHSFLLFYILHTHFYYPCNGTALLPFILPPFPALSLTLYTFLYTIITIGLALPPPVFFPFPHYLLTLPSATYLLTCITILPPPHGSSLDIVVIVPSGIMPCVPYWTLCCTHYCVATPDRFANILPLPSLTTPSLLQDSVILPAIFLPHPHNLLQDGLPHLYYYHYTLPACWDHMALFGPVTAFIVVYAFLFYTFVTPQPSTFLYCLVPWDLFV